MVTYNFTEMEGYFLWTHKTKKEFLVVILAMLTITVVATTAMSWSANQSSPLPSREDYDTSPPENYRPPIEELDPQTTSVKVSVNQAIRQVEKMWVVLGADVSTYLIRDVLSDRVLWLLEWKVEGAVVVSALVDADKGKVVSLTDFRRSARVDNLKSTDKAVNIAIDLLGKLGIDTAQMSDPIVAIRRTPNIGASQEIIYDVQWRQVYEGISVMEGVALVDIDAETLDPVGFSIHTLDVDNVNINPAVSKDQAAERARNFVESKGYKLGETVDILLVIGRPNYYWEGTPTKLGDPTLIWNVLLKDDAGRRIDVWVDATTGSVIGGTLYR